jgi:hypothetical protein
MYGKSITISLILLISTPLQAWPDKWRTQDTIAETALAGIALIDYCQSLEMIHDKRYTERNMFLPEHPTRCQYLAFGVSALAVHAGITYMLRRKYRWWWQCVGITIEGMNVIGNFQISAGIYWPWE